MNRGCEQKDLNKQCVDQTGQQALLPVMPLYGFEKAAPPMLTERMLQHQLEERQARRQALLVTVAGVLTQLILLVVMVLLYEYMPTFALIGIGYVVVSLTAGLATAVIYVERRRTIG